MRIQCVVLFILIISITALSIEGAAPLAGSYAADTEQCAYTGSACIKSCVGKTDGEYQSCLGCSVYASCSGEELTDDIACQDGSNWNDDVPGCRPGDSPTCTECVDEPETTAVQIEPTTTASVDVTATDTEQCVYTGPVCIKSCVGRDDGEYQSCLGCSVYARCISGVLTDHIACPVGTLWNDDVPGCRPGDSPTCPGCVDEPETTMVATEPTTTASADQSDNESNEVQETKESSTQATTTASADQSDNESNEVQETTESSTQATTTASAEQSDNDSNEVEETTDSSAEPTTSVISQATTTATREADSPQTSAAPTDDAVDTQQTTAAPTDDAVDSQQTTAAPTDEAVDSQQTTIYPTVSDEEVLSSLDYTLVFDAMASSTDRQMYGDAVSTFLSDIFANEDYFVGLTLTSFGAEDDSMSVDFTVDFSVNVLIQQEITHALALRSALEEASNTLLLDGLQVPVKQVLYSQSDIEQSTSLSVEPLDECSGLTAIGYCKNGANCVVVNSQGICQCPTGYNGLQCQYEEIPALPEDEVVQEIRLSFTLALDYGSADFNNPNDQFANRFAFELRMQILMMIPRVNNVILGEFFEGSVGVTPILQISEAVDDAGVSDIATTFSDNLNNNGGVEIGGQSISVSSAPSLLIPSIDGDYREVLIDGVCFLYNAEGSCKNGGSCVVDALGQPGCICTEEYTGDLCEKSTDTSFFMKPGLIAVIVVVSVLILLGLAIAIQVCASIYSRRRERNHFIAMMNSHAYFGNKMMQPPFLPAGPVQGNPASAVFMQNLPQTFWEPTADQWNRRISMDPTYQKIPGFSRQTSREQHQMNILRNDANRPLPSIPSGDEISDDIEELPVSAEYPYQPAQAQRSSYPYQPAPNHANQPAPNHWFTNGPIPFGYFGRANQAPRTSNFVNNMPPIGVAHMSSMWPEGMSYAQQMRRTGLSHLSPMRQQSGMTHLSPMRHQSGMTHLSPMQHRGMSHLSPMRHQSRMTHLSPMQHRGMSNMPAPGAWNHPGQHPSAFFKRPAPWWRI